VKPYADVTRSAGLLPRLYRQYDALIAGSESGRNELAALLPEAGPPIAVIPLGHLNGAYGSVAVIGRMEARDQIGLRESDAVVLFLGQIKREKGLEHLLRALPAVMARVPAVRLIVAGRPYHDDVGAYEQLIGALQIDAYVRRRWEYVPDDEVGLYYRAADVVALPYTRVYQSGVALTAYAFARPVVASAVGGLTEQVVDGKTGWLVPPADPSALAEALASALAPMRWARTDSGGRPRCATGTRSRGRRWASTSSFRSSAGLTEGRAEPAHGAARGWR
jgi:D-inositol-3-phosphate glycosyltransferase